MSKQMNVSDFLKKGTLLFFPLRDTLALSIGNLPLRIGELWAAVYLISLFCGNRKPKKNELFIALLLIANLILSILGFVLHEGSYDTGFASKYVARNILNIIFVISFISSSIIFDRNEIDWVMKYSFWIQLVSFFILYVTRHGYVLGMVLGWNEILKTGQVIHIGSIVLPRFFGTSSEPGYLTAFLPMLFYYYYSTRDKRKNFYISSIVVMTLLTFSSAVYVSMFAVVVYLLIKKRGISKRYIITILIGLIVLIGLYSFAPKIQNVINESIVYKISAFLSNKPGNYSASERTTHIANAWNLFVDSSFRDKLFGRGTGGYLYYTLNFGKNLLSYDVEEAYNLYMSTLVDRGIVGIIILLVLLVQILKYRIKSDVFSDTIAIGIVLQVLHWLITGNMWQYYFWAEVIMLMGYYRFATGFAKKQIFISGLKEYENAKKD